jgi:trimeric autotransporter adhesin
MNSPFKFLRRVRIHGGECGAVARALHHEAQKVALTQNEQSLISDEKAFSRQADDEKSSKSTFIERKQMSTKTTFKRIALVAVSALGFGLLSVVPAKAAMSFTGMYVSKYSSSNYTNADVAAQMVVGAASTTVTSTAHGLTSTSIGKAIYSIDHGYIGTIASITNANTFELTAFPTVALVEDGTGAVAKLRIGTPVSTYSLNPVLNANQISGMTVVAGKTVALDLVGGANAASGGQARAIIDGVGVVSTEIDNTTLKHFMVAFAAPGAAGTYPMTIEYNEDGSFDGVIANTSKVSFTLTVTAAPGLSTALSTAYLMGPAAGAAAGNITTNAVSYFGLKTSGTKIAQIEVTLRNSDGSAHASGSLVAASVSGSGFVTVDTTADTAAGSARASSVAASSGGLAYVHIAADGSAGTGTITVTVTDAVTSVTSTLGTWTVTSYGAVASIAVDTTYYTIGYATGDTTGAADTSRGTSSSAVSPLAATETPAFVVVTKDAAGQVSNISNSLVPTIVSSNPVSVSGGTCVLDDGTSTYASGDGVGYYNCSFTTTASSKSGDKATLTIRTLNPADTSTYLTTTIDVTVGGDPATESLAFDKATYSAGENMVLTRSCLDAAGNNCADGATAPAIVFSKAIGGTAPGASWYVGGVRAGGSATYPSVFAPSITGDFEARMNGYVNEVLTSITTTAAVSDDSSTAAANAASDAASEAIDAANAATDAANLAAEAADAATVAAEEARDAADAATTAVEALATEVATLMAALKAQITTLANTVAKIAKKVKA